MLEIEKGSGRGRLDDYVLASAMLRERPLLGWGPRRWEDASSAVAHDVAERHASAYVFWPTPNSDLARIAGEQGLAGLLTLGALLLALGHAAYRRLRVETHLLHESMGFTVLLGLSVYGVNALLDAPLFRPSSVAVIACLCALLRGTSPALTCIPQRLSARVAVAAGFVLVILAGVRVSAAAIIRHGDGSIEARTTAQRFWPRPGVQQAIVVSLANAGKCAEAEEAAETALIWTPHHWAAPHFVALCLRRAGDHERSLELRQRALAIEPHLDALIAHHRQASGDLRIDHPPRHGSKQDADALEANARF
jgi:O-antigen ligase